MYFNKISPLNEGILDIIKKYLSKKEPSTNNTQPKQQKSDLLSSNERKNLKYIIDKSYKPRNPKYKFHHISEGNVDFYMDAIGYFVCDKNDKTSELESEIIPDFIHHIHNVSNYEFHISVDPEPIPYDIVKNKKVVKEQDIFVIYAKKK